MQLVDCQDKPVVALPLGKLFSQPHMSYGVMLPYTSEGARHCNVLPNHALR